MDESFIDNEEDTFFLQIAKHRNVDNVRVTIFSFAQREDIVPPALSSRTFLFCNSLSTFSLELWLSHHQACSQYTLTQHKIKARLGF